MAEKAGIEKVSLNFSSYKSETQVKRSTGLDPLRIHGHLLQANILPDFRSATSKNQVVASLVHKILNQTTSEKVSLPNYFPVQRALITVGMWRWQVIMPTTWILILA